MEGGGEFTHADGTILKGTFKNNYFNDRNKRFLNPMLSLPELQSFVEQSEKFNSTTEQEKKDYENRVRVFRVGSDQDLIQALNETKQMSRVPLFMTTKESQLNKELVIGHLSGLVERQISEIDLRAVGIDF